MKQISFHEQVSRSQRQQGIQVRSEYIGLLQQVPLAETPRDKDQLFSRKGNKENLQQ